MNLLNQRGNKAAAKFQPSKMGPMKSSLVIKAAVQCHAPGSLLVWWKRKQERRVEAEGTPGEQENAPCANFL